MNTGATTFTQGTNSWLDDFNHHLSLADLGAGYRTFTFGSAQQVWWRHADHWMHDVRGRQQGGGSMRPDKSFQFVNGKLVVEFDMAAGINAYGGESWPEITITTAAQPTGDIVDPLYHYGRFGGQWTFGCRLQSDRVPVCALFDASGRDVFSGGRIWEVTWFLQEGSTHFGGYPSGNLANAWRSCGNVDPDTNCRDRFRLELSQTGMVLYVNGVRYFEDSGWTGNSRLPDSFVNGNVYVYFADWQYIVSSNEAVRYHWDRISINPGAPGTPPTSTPTPAPPTVSPTATPTSTPIPPSSQYDVTWTGDNTPASIPANNTVNPNLSFRNDGSLTWAQNGANAVHVAYHWRSGACPGTGTAVWDGIRTNLTGNIATGGSANNLAATVRTPSTPGTYCLQYDLVREGVTWFSTQGADTLAKTVNVTGATSTYGVDWGSHNTPSAMTANSLVPVTVSFTNSGTLAWSAGGANPVRLAYHWRSGACPGTAVTVWDGIRTNLTG
ncbi:MAG TPA: hypothetical protein VI876_12755, partial [Dehalococcoidia bacterium]|nr:hypothetical protein [Dehalococcoidia bacterium]